MNFIYYDPPSNYDRSNHKPSDFETAAAALDLTLNSIGDTIGDVGLSFLGKQPIFLKVDQCQPHQKSWTGCHYF